MGNPPTEPLSRVVDAMVVGLGLLDVEHEPENDGDNAVDGTPGSLMIRAAAMMIAEAAESVEDGSRSEWAAKVVADAFVLAGRAGRDQEVRFALDRPVRAVVRKRLQAAVDALVGVYPYA